LNFSSFYAILSVMSVNTTIKNQVRANVPDLRAGQVVRIHERIAEGDKERIQIFEGLVMAVRHGRGLDGSFTVRKIGANQVGVERVFPLHLPSIQKVEVIRQEKVRRAKLNYVRNQVSQKTKKRKAELKDAVYDFAVAEEVKQENKDGEETIQNQEMEGSVSEQQDVAETADPVMPAVPPDGPVNLMPVPELKSIAEISRAFSVSMLLAVKLTASALLEAWVISRTVVALLVSA